MITPRRAPRAWGKIRKLPSGRYQASYLDGTATRRTAPATFPTRAGADAWLSAQHAALDAGTWRDPGSGAETFAAYAARWLDERGLKPRTEHDYRRILDRLLLPEFGAMPLKAITPAAVRSWYARLDPAAPVMRAHAYGLLRAMLKTAAADDLITASPCRIRGVGQAKTAKRITPATLAELEVIAAAMPGRLPADGPARRVVRAAVRRADRAAPRRRRPGARRAARAARRRPGRAAGGSWAPRSPRRGSATWRSRRT